MTPWQPQKAEAKLLMLHSWPVQRQIKTGGRMHKGRQPFRGAAINKVPANQCTSQCRHKVSGAPFACHSLKFSQEAPTVAHKHKNSSLLTATSHESLHSARTHALSLHPSLPFARTPRPTCRPHISSEAPPESMANLRALLVALVASLCITSAFAGAWYKEGGECGPAIHAQ